MSRATLYVRFSCGAVRYGLYNGTIDIACARLYSTPDTAWATYNLGLSPPWSNYSDEPVSIATDYGAGSWWRGRATWDFLTAGFDPYEADPHESGLPAWAQYPRVGAS